MSSFARWKVFVFATLLLATAASGQYKRTDLVTDTGPGGTAADPRLVNAWGLVALPFSPFWLSDNNTGVSTLYTGGGQVLGLTVRIPGAQTGVEGTPTGIVGNLSSDFAVTEGPNSGPAFFIFATLDGTISGWNPAVAGIVKGKSHATLGWITPGAMYTGLAIGNSNGHNFLFAADDGANRRVDVYDGNFQPVDLGPGAFVDPEVPKNFAPYGIQTITDSNGEQTVWVTYTALNKAQSGFIAAFTTAGVFKKHIALNGPLHSPWGVALAPADFGPMSNALLVSNNISRGRIDAFDPDKGTYLGPLRDTSGKAIEIDGLWGIEFGQDGGPNGAHNQLFFTGGPSNYNHGVFGVIDLP